MLWRHGYSTRILLETELPSFEATALDGMSLIPPEDYVFIGGFDLRSFGEMEIWRRLVREDTSSDLRLFFVSSSIRRGEAKAILAPSLHPDVGIIADPESVWRNLLQPDRPERGFAAAIRGGIAQTVMIGPPTEEAWDEFKRVSAS